jgi:alginate O-acetyltransferase complex protein AlgJ
MTVRNPDQNPLPPLPEGYLPREHPLYRPRHGIRQRLALVCAVVFFLLPAFAYVVGVRPGEFENHRLAPFPSPLGGWSFFGGLQPWATDHLALRQQGVQADGWLSRSVFGEAPSFGGNDTEAPVQGGPPPTAQAYQFPAVFPGRDGWLYLGAELASHCQQTQPISSTVARLRLLHDAVVASGRKFVVVVAPDKATIVPQYLPADYPGKTCRTAVADQFWHAVDGVPYVLDVRGDLAAWGRQLGKPVYGPLDAHWGDEGGVTLTRRVAERLQPGISRNWLIEPGQTWQVAADLPPLYGGSGTSTGRHYSILTDGVHDHTRDVGVDYDSPLHFGTATGPGTYHESVGMLSDSFTMRATRYLAAVFGDITILDQSQIVGDGGVAAANMLAANQVVVVEVAERTLVSGQFILLDPPVEDELISVLTSHPIR